MDLATRLLVTCQSSAAAKFNIIGMSREGKNYFFGHCTYTDIPEMNNGTSFPSRASDIVEERKGTCRDLGRVPFCLNV